MKKSVSLLRKIIILLIAVPLFIVGVILIPLPGPGLIICFLALFLLSLEFDWAQKHFDRAKAEVKKIIKTARDRQDKINKKYK